MMISQAELIAIWKTDEGKPHKGRLIDMNAYAKDPTNPVCMCAQGQVLSRIGGRSPEYLADLNQFNADAEVAKLLGISRAHAVLLRKVNDDEDGAPASVLENPEAILGDQWSKVLDFWWYLDRMTDSRWNAARNAARSLQSSLQESPPSSPQGSPQGKMHGNDAWAVARDSARDAARSLQSSPQGKMHGDAAWAVARDAARDAALASNEIQSRNIVKARGTPFYFLPVFGFASLDDIPARPASYGTGQL